MSLVLQPSITDIQFDPPPTNSSLLLSFNDSQEMNCTASGGPRIMTTWWFVGGTPGSNGSMPTAVANGSDSVTYTISSSSTNDTGTYYCVATIDGMNDTSAMYTLFGKTCVNSATGILHNWPLSRGGTFHNCHCRSVISVHISQCKFMFLFTLFQNYNLQIWTMLFFANFLCPCPVYN